MYGLTILGNSSALPAFDRHPTAQALTWGEQIFLIDCGEGTQMQLARYKIRRSRIHHIFISHLHGDHYFGLIGLITSMGLLGREAPLHIYGPAELQKIIEVQLCAAANQLRFELNFHANTKDSLILDDEKFSVHCFAVKHRIECWGYLFKEKKMPRKLQKEKADQYNIDSRHYHQLQMGEDHIAASGEIVKNEWVTIPNSPARSYAYCADTIYDKSLAEKVNSVSLLYHEATYLDDLRERAASRFHSTAYEAGCLAKIANAKRLLIGHFSSKYEEIDIFEKEAKTAFEEAELAIEGVTFRLLS